MKRGDRREEVRRLLALRDREGLTYAELASRTGESPNALSWWAWRLRRETQDRRSERFVEVEMVDDNEGGRDAGLELLLIGGGRVRVERGFDEESLRRVVRALSC